MRIDSLDLTGYGRLSGRTLGGFGPFTVVHGPNEAGKSTLRRLLRDLLFGFPAGSMRSHPYAFSKTMEARAALTLQDGRNLTIHRKRSTQEFLRIEPVEFGNDAWKSLLSGMDDALYGRMLCCSAQEMVSGTSEALRKGSLLETLRMDASGGLRSAKALLAESEATLAPFATGRKRRKLELERARAELAGISTGWDELERKSSRLRELEERISALQERMLSLDAEIRQHERSERIAGIAEEVASLEERLAREGAPTVFPPRARERHADLTTERERLRSDLRDFEKTRRETLDELARLPAPDPILDADAGILEPLQGRRDGVAARLRALPGLRERRQAARARLDQATAPLFPAPADPAPAAGQPSLFDPVASARPGQIPSNATPSTARELARSRASWREAEAAEALARRDLEHRSGTLAGMTRPGELDARDRDLANLWRERGRGVEAARSALEAASMRERTAERALARLEPRLCLAGLPPRDALLRARLPPEGEARAAAAEWREAAGMLESLERRLEAIERELGDLERDAPGDLATVERRDARRARRDGLWKAVKARIEGAPLPDESTLLAPGQTLAGAFEASLRDADADSDALLAQGERYRSAAALRTERTARQLERERAQRLLNAAQGRWDALWAPSTLRPGSDPVSGIAWLETRLEAQEHWVDLEEAQREQERARGILDPFTESVRSLLGLPDLSFEDAQAEAQTTYDRAKALRQRHQDFERDHARLLSEIETARTHHASLAARLKECAGAWTDAWRAAFPGHDLPESPDAFLEGFQRLLEALGALASEEASLAEAEAERDEVARTLAPVLVALGMAGGAEHLGALLDRRAAAMDVRTRRERSEIHLQGCERSIAQRKDDLRRIEEQLGSLWREAGFPEEPAFLAALDAYEQAEHLRIHRDTLRRKLDAASSDDVRIAREHPPAHWTGLLEAARRAAGELGAERDGLLRDKGALDGEFETLARRNDEPLERRAALLQSVDTLNEEARAHLRNRIVRLVLQRACDSFASKHTPPLQAWSGQYLSTITGGRWDAIDLSRDDRLAVESSARGETLDESALSTGTADQVRLALRMAVARQWAASHEALPFLLDDVLVATDAERTARALEALRGLAEHVQVLYFTCHASLAEAAGKLGASVVEI